MTDYIYTILLIQLCNQIRFVVSFTRRCNESLQTVQKVSLCPTNLSAYEAAAKQKNCSSFNADSCHSFQYHCVLSEDFHSLVEVCAPSLNIIVLRELPLGSRTQPITRSSERIYSMRLQTGFWIVRVILKKAIVFEVKMTEQHGILFVLYVLQ
uniref:Uncharacterized protein LOC111100623 isoform X12 n=1 Tax=Crassostrea virginica TaxID=6565 RepID=A0A8B8AAB4_CRAVI|nr:uncharacterized protein LOC111100623 isoform X12 [Crassostrea virginica]